MKTVASKVNPTFKIAQPFPGWPVVAAVRVDVSPAAARPMKLVVTQVDFEIPTPTHHATALPTARLCC